MDPIEIARRFVALLRSGALDSRLWEPPSSEEPPLPVREPKPVMPGGRFSSVALDEPEPDMFVETVGPRA